MLTGTCYFRSRIVLKVAINYELNGLANYLMRPRTKLNHFAWCGSENFERQICQKTYCYQR